LGGTGERPGALVEFEISEAMNGAFDGTRNNFALGVPAGGMIEHPMDEKRPILHQDFHCGSFHSTRTPHAGTRLALLQERVGCPRSKSLRFQWTSHCLCAR